MFRGFNGTHRHPAVVPITRSSMSRDSCFRCFFVANYRPDEFTRGYEVQGIVYDDGMLRAPEALARPWIEILQHTECGMYVVLIQVKVYQVGRLDCFEKHTQRN